LGMFAIELGVPWLVLAPPRFRRLRLAACALLVLGQLGIAGTGNYGFFNLLSIVLCVPLLDDAVLRRAIPLRLAAGEPEPRWKRIGIKPFVQPHMPRLDWQMWFAALNPEGAQSWLSPLARHLLAGTPDVLALLGENPFPERAPRYLRLAYYRYRFSTPPERARSGDWWE